MGVGMASNLVAHLEELVVDGFRDGPVGGIRVGWIGVVADVYEVGADEVVLLLPLLQHGDKLTVNPWAAVGGRDVRRVLRILRVVARVEDTGKACDVHRKAGRRAEHCILDGMLQQVAVAEQSRR